MKESSNPKMFREGSEEKEEDEDVLIKLTSINPQACINKVRFDLPRGTFVKMKISETMIDHLDIPSIIILKDSEQGVEQLKIEGLLSPGEKRTKDIIYDEVSEDKNIKPEDKAGDEEEKRSDEMNLTNQFKYLERGTQTHTNSGRPADTQTEPPPRQDNTKKLN